jgi:hypothetical protein
LFARLPEGWIEKIDEEGRKCYYNSLLKKTEWKIRDETEAAVAEKKEVEENKKEESGDKEKEVENGL